MTRCDGMNAMDFVHWPERHFIDRETHTISGPLRFGGLGQECGAFLPAWVHKKTLFEDRFWSTGRSVWYHFIITDHISFYIRYCCCVFRSGGQAKPKWQREKETHRTPVFGDSVNFCIHFLFFSGRAGAAEAAPCVFTHSTAAGFLINVISDL